MLNILLCRYTKEGFCKGEITTPPPNPIRLEWDLPKPVSVWITTHAAEDVRICR